MCRSIMFAGISTFGKKKNCQLVITEFFKNNNIKSFLKIMYVTASPILIKWHGFVIDALYTVIHK